MTVKSDKILVTGGTGFTGGQLCKRLAADGRHVRTIVRDPARAQHLTEMGVEVCAGDLTDAASVARAMEGIDRVYHIAALFREGKATYDELYAVNTQGTKNVLDAAVAAKVKRFVHCSTIGVHGDVKNPPAHENSPYNPGDAYQETKLEGERIAQEYMKAGDIPIAIFRPAGIYGPGDMRFLKLIKSIKNGRFLMIGSGEINYHMVYIDDLVDGILLCGEKEEAVGNIFILAGEEIVTLNRLVQIISNLVGTKPPRFKVPFKPVYLAGHLCEIVCKPFGINPPIFRRRVDFFRKTRSFDISKAKKVLGYQPKVNLETGLKRTIDWYSQEGLL